MPQYESDPEGAVLAEDETKLEKPRLYKVLLHNDNFTTMEFVVHILETIFNRSETEAIQLMLQVHLQGVGVAGIYPLDIAETKSVRVTQTAREHEFPLLCTIEEI